MYMYIYIWASLVAVLKSPPATAGDAGSIPGVRKIPWRKEMATCSNILAWETPWTEEPGELLSRGLQSQAGLSD